MFVTYSHVLGHYMWRVGPFTQAFASKWVCLRYGADTNRSSEVSHRVVNLALGRGNFQGEWTSGVLKKLASSKSLEVKECGQFLTGPILMAFRSDSMRMESKNLIVTKSLAIFYHRFGDFYCVNSSE